MLLDIAPVLLAPVITVSRAMLRSGTNFSHGKFTAMPITRVPVDPRLSFRSCPFSACTEGMLHRFKDGGVQA
jgi:hypothetical protein